MASLTRSAPAPTHRRVALGAALAAATVLAVVALAGLPGASRDGPAVVGAARTDVRILLGVPATLDPAAQGDIGSATFSSQLFESLTSFDAELVLRPALARSWEVLDDGRRVVFHLRPGLTFSDGTPLTGADVVRSWLRIIDPDRPSPLASLMLDVRGAEAYLTGTSRNPDSVGLSADGGDVGVDLERPAADFPSIVASPTFAVVPPGIDAAGALEPDDFVGSGGYVLSAITDTGLTLAANGRYWAGPPAIETAHLLTSIGGRSPVAAFEADDADQVGISGFDAAWIRYDPTLGPQLRLEPSLSLTYLGFDVSEPPFDDPKVRQAFGAAVDWQRITTLGAAGVNVPADSMVPPGIPGAPDGDWRPAHDPAAARALLRAAGYPGGAGFPRVVFGTGFSPYADGIKAELERELGVTVDLETYDDHFGRLTLDPPGLFTVGWVADYPGPNDFLGVLLRTSSTNDYGRWSSSEFDAAIDAALETTDPTRAKDAWADVLALVQRDVPVVPLSYGDAWSLSRTGLLGAGQNGLGLLRVAGLAWGAGQ